MDTTRSYLPMTLEDLEWLRQIAVTEQQSFFQRNPRYKPLADRIVCVALCQGAALHWIDGTNGINDLDVWTFYAGLPSLQVPYRRQIPRIDFGDPKFGKTSNRPDFTGRRVDLLGRSLQVEPDTDPVLAIRSYLSAGGTKSARELAKQAVVLLEPLELLGTVVWPLHASLVKDAVG